MVVVDEGRILVVDIEGWILLVIPLLVIPFGGKLPSPSSDNSEGGSSEGDDGSSEGDDEVGFVADVICCVADVVVAFCVVAVAVAGVVGFVGSATCCLFTIPVIVPV